MQFLSAFGPVADSNLAVIKPIFSLKTIAPRTFIAGSARLLVRSTVSESFHIGQPSLKNEKYKETAKYAFVRRDEKTLKV
jgi:hypothetical protein